MDQQDIDNALISGVQIGHANLLRGLADMMRAVADDPMFPSPKFTTDTSARGVTRAWAENLDGAAEQIEQREAHR